MAELLQVTSGNEPTGRNFLQVVMRTAVSPWTEDLVLTDAFRAPLAEVFKLLEVIRNYQLENR